tara:strand:+ start:144 stop:365 length:222 start_codon:yes stop_codon:yes gene_type:complete
MKKSKHKMIFEDSFLSDQEKYKKINSLQCAAPRFWTVILSLNVIICPFLFIFTNMETDNSNLSPIVALKNLKI